MKIIFEEEALNELNQSISFIAKNNPENAKMVLDDLLTFSSSLAVMPYRYPKELNYNKHNIRVAIKHKHKIVFQINESHIIILRFFPARQNPDKLKP